MSRARTLADFGADVPSTFANGITVVDQWRLTSNVSSNVTLTPWERPDDGYAGTIGTGLTESSGIFSFPSTGMYLILVQSNFIASGADGTMGIVLGVTTDNSSYDNAAFARAGDDGGSSDHATCSYIIDVTDTTNVKFKLTGSSITSPSAIQGDSNENKTTVTALRLGDT